LNVGFTKGVVIFTAGSYNERNTATKNNTK
jgi:hypothetical protein